MPAKKGDKVRIDYEGTLDDGTLFDSSEKHNAPLEFVLGSGMVIEGFDKAVDGMEVGEEKEFRLEPEDAYGERQDSLVTRVSKQKFPEGIDVQVGMDFTADMENGISINGTVVEVDGDTVIIDFNHPLAGQALKFKITLVEILE